MIYIIFFFLFHVFFSFSAAQEDICFDAIKSGNVPILARYLCEGLCPNTDYLLRAKDFILPDEKTKVLLGLSTPLLGISPSIEISKLLLQYKALIDQQNVLGISALMFASQFPQDIRYKNIKSDIVVFLVESHANLALKDQRGMTALDFAIASNAEGNIRYLKDLIKLAEKIPLAETIET